MSSIVPSSGSDYTLAQQNEEHNLVPATQNSDDLCYCTFRIPRRNAYLLAKLVLVATTVIAWITQITFKIILIVTVLLNDPSQDTWRINAAMVETYLCISGFITWWNMTQKTNKNDLRRRRILPNADRLILLLGTAGVFLSALVYSFHKLRYWSTLMFVYGLFLLIPSQMEFSDYRRYYEPHKIKHLYYMFAITSFILLLSFVVEIIIIPHFLIGKIHKLAKKTKKHYGEWVFIFMIGCRPFFLMILYRMIVQAFELPNGQNEAERMLNDSNLQNGLLHNANGNDESQDSNLDLDREIAGDLRCIQAFDMITSVGTFIIALAYFIFDNGIHYRFEFYGVTLHICLVLFELYLLTWTVTLIVQTWNKPFKKSVPKNTIIPFIVTVLWGIWEFFYSNLIAHDFVLYLLPIRLEWEWLALFVSALMFYAVASLDVTQRPVMEFVILKYFPRFSWYLNVVYVYNLVMMLRELITLVFMTMRMYEGTYTSTVIHIQLFWIAFPAMFHLEMMKLIVLTKQILRHGKRVGPSGVSPDTENMLGQSLSERLSNRRGLRIRRESEMSSFVRSGAQELAR